MKHKAKVPTCGNCAFLIKNRNFNKHSVTRYTCKTRIWNYKPCNVTPCSLYRQKCEQKQLKGD